jgi:hypothetical protein
MPDLLARENPMALRVEVDERLARAELRRQIGHLERELAGLFAEAFGRVELDQRLSAAASGPRLLDLGELERLRDELATRVSESRQRLAERARFETANRELVQRMLADPAAFKWVQVSRDELGLHGCGHWHSRPRLGPLGMLMGWWRVRISSGCPLAGRLAAVEQEEEARQAEQAGGGSWKTRRAGEQSRAAGRRP